MNPEVEARCQEDKLRAWRPWENMVKYDGYDRGILRFVLEATQVVYVPDTNQHRRRRLLLLCA